MKQVRDPMGCNEWIDCDASTDERAVRQFLRDQGYDEADYDPDKPFALEVCDGEDDQPRKVEVRVIPMHFQVSGARR